METVKLFEMFCCFGSRFDSTELSLDKSFRSYKFKLLNTSYLIQKVARGWIKEVYSSYQ
jgi:hypothetical protein